jgi:hypothetical protein
MALAVLYGYLRFGPGICLVAIFGGRGPRGRPARADLLGPPDDERRPLSGGSALTGGTPAPKIVARFWIMQNQQ